MSLITSTKAGGTGGGPTTVTTPAVDTTDSLFIILVGSCYGDSTYSVSDSKGNTYVPLTVRTGALYSTQLFYCIGPTVGSGHTFTISNGLYVSIAALAFDNDISAFDAESGTAPGTQPGSIAPGGDNRLFITGACLNDDADSPTIDSGFTIAQTESHVNGAHVGSSIAYKLQTTGSAENPTWSGCGSIPLAMAAFEVAAPPIPPPILLTDAEQFDLQLALNEAVAIWTVHLHFPILEDIPAKDFYWATGKNIELEDGNIYEQILTTIPKGRHQTGRGNDYLEFSAVNIDYSLYQQLLPYQDLIERCECTVRKAYEFTQDLYVSGIEFVGYIKDFTLDGTDKSFKLTVNSDMSRSNFFAGNRILTRERCGTEFNFNGLLSADDSLCGWQTGQGGNPIFCSKLENGVDGCNDHNNRHRYVAVPALSTADVQIVIPGLGLGGSDGSGWINGGGPCFAETVYVLMSDLSTKPIHQVTTDDTTIGFDIFDEDRLISAEVLHTLKTEVDEIWTADFEFARLELRKDHLFYLGKRMFTPVAFLGSRMAVGIDSAQKPSTSRLYSIDRSIENLFVYNLHTTSNNYIVTDRYARFFYFVHNNKPVILPY